MLIMFNMLIGIGICALLAYVIAGSMWITVRKMLASPAAEKDPDAEPEILAAVPTSIGPFLAGEGFRFVAAYSFHNSRFGIWIRISPDPPLRIFSLLRTVGAAGTVHEFVTEFSDTNSLTTTNARSAFLFPRRFGSFLQSFPRSSIEQLWQTHLKGEEYILAHLAIQLQECRLSVLERFQRGVRLELSYVKSVPWWPVRGIYWYLRTRLGTRRTPNQPR